VPRSRSDSELVLRQNEAQCTKRQREDQALLPRIKVTFENCDKTYGAGRIVKELRKQGTRV